MEISRRHLQPLEEIEIREAMELSELLATRGADIEAADARATEMQREVDGMTRNQRRVLNKRMAKAAKKRK